MNKPATPFPILLFAMTLVLMLSAPNWGINIDLSNSPGGIQNRTQAHHTTKYDYPPQLDLLPEIWSVLNENHLHSQDMEPSEFARAAIEGMLDQLNDPYAMHITANQYDLETDDLQGFFEGIGAEVSMRNGKAIIVAPIKDTPADDAGIRPGDIILRVNGKSVEGFSLNEIVDLIRGPSGESVTLTIERPPYGNHIEITIIRDIIEMTSTSLRILTRGRAHISISTFTDTTPDDVEEALVKLTNLGAKGLILDLRNNPGGVLSAVVKTTEHFLDGGLVLYQEDPKSQRNEWHAKKGGAGTSIPMVVLINGGSASGSEVLAGALSDHDRAILIGEKTFGKGSVNTLYQLSDGSGLYFTTGRWFTPNGNIIEGKGLNPDIEVIQSTDGSDVQLDRAIEILDSQIDQLEKKRNSQRHNSS